MADRSVAVVGASTERSKFGNKAVRAYMAEGWLVYPVNPKGGEIEGLEVFTSLKSISGHVTRVALYLPPEVGVGMLPDIADVRPDEFFINPGAESDELIRGATELGLRPVLACAIVDIDRSPAEFPD